MQRRVRKAGWLSPVGMIRVVSWNIAKRWQPWHDLVEMARQGEAVVALLQEAGNPPPRLGSGSIRERRFLEAPPERRPPRLCPLVPGRAIVRPGGRPVVPVGSAHQRARGAWHPRERHRDHRCCQGDATRRPSGRCVRCGSYVYPPWMKPHSSIRTSWQIGASDVSAHRIHSDYSALIGPGTESSQRAI